MSISAVQQYVGAQLNAVLGPGGSSSFPNVGTIAIPALQVLRGPSTVTTPTGPQAFVRCVRFVEEPLSFGSYGSGVATKQVLHTVRVLVRYVVSMTSITGDVAIDIITTIADTVLHALRSVANQASLTDPASGAVSRIFLTGAKQSGDFKGPWAITSQRAQLHGVDFTTEVTELITGPGP